MGDISLSETEADGNQVFLNFAGRCGPAGPEEEGLNEACFVGEKFTLTSAKPIVKVVATMMTFDGVGNQLSGNGYTAQDNIGTWTGSNYSVTLVNSGELGSAFISSLEVFLDKDAIPEYVDFACNGTLDGDSLVGETPFFTIIQKRGIGSNPPAYTNPWRIYGGNTVEIKMKNNLALIGLEIEHPESEKGDNFKFEPAANETIAEPTDGTVLRTITLDGAAELLISNTSKKQSHWNRVRVYIGNLPSLYLTPKQFDFGTVTPGSTRTLPLILIAQGATKLLSANLPAHFLLEENLPLDLEKGSRTTLHFTFSPEQTGTYDGEIKLNIGDTAYTLPVSAQCKEKIPVESVIYKELPAQNAFYDFHAEGSKGCAYTEYPINPWGWGLDYDKGITTLTASQFNGFVDEKVFSDGFLDRLDYVEDINRDGYPDFCQYDCYAPPRNAICRMMLSNADGTYTYIPQAWFLPHLDLNRDGRTDYLRYINNGKTELFLNLSTPAGTYTETRIALLSKEAYYASFDPDAWYEGSPFTGDGSLNILTMPGGANGLSGIPFPDAGPKEDPTLYRLPTRVVDLNGDGRPDLMDETNGYILYNMSDTRWVLNYTGGYTKVADLNGDGYSDLVVNQDGKLVYHKYIGNGNFQTSTLYENLAVDNQFHVQDLDGDGSQDLLVTISYAQTGNTRAYIVPFLNDGAGNLTQQPEFSTDKPYEFGHLQDIDGDGILDMLAWELAESQSYVVFLKGKRGGFEPGVRILDLGTKIATGNYQYAYYNFRDVMHINAADIDGDGIMEVWTSGVEKDMTHIYKIEGSPALTAPQKPAPPVLIYEEASRCLRVDWAAGTDTYSSPCDLTYALRIGTTPGGDDILAANALADGTRRDYGRGNQAEQRYTIFDLSTWAPGTYYVSLQAINNRHMGSAWSEPASFTHEALPGFEVDKTQMTVVDTLTVCFTALPDAYEAVWDFDGGKVVSEGKGYKKITFDTYGEKVLRLSLSAPDGKSAAFRQKTDVVPNYFSFTDTVETAQTYLNAGFEYLPPLDYLDCNNDGYLDAVKSDGVYLNDGTGHFSKPVALWNTGLSFSQVAILDYDRDGYADIVYKGSGLSDGYLHNNGNGTFTKKTDAAVSSYFQSNRLWDFDGDGLKDGFSYKSSYFIKWHADGSQSSIEPTCPNGNREFSFPSYGAYFVERATNYRVKDFNGDGLLDFYDFDYQDYKYKGILIYLNEGGFAFSEHLLPFASPIANEDFGGDRDKYWVDMNADGFLDIVACRNSDEGAAFYILYNEENRGFSAPAFVSLPVGIKYGGNYFSSFYFYDIDNNGYVDVLFNAEHENGNSGFHTVYFGGDGVLRQYFDTDASHVAECIVDLNADGIVDFHGSTYNSDSWGYDDFGTPLLKSAASNERPSAPVGLQAEMTDNGLLISWEPARDDRTPYAAMRYNISVKRKDRTGAGVYILSPLNGGDTKNAMQPTELATNLSTADYSSDWRKSEEPYLRGTSCRIPAEVLTSGEELEICVQAIDLWGMAGAFSETLFYQVGSNAKISAPATACAGIATVVSYIGTATTATPEWDFDGGVAEGSGFGPYSVYWNEAGTKRVSLRAGDEECYVTVKVNENPSAYFSIPEYVQYDVPTVISLPEVSPKATFKWNVALDDGFIRDNLTSRYANIEAKPSYRYGSVRFPNNPEIKTRRLLLTVTQDGCTSYHESPTLYLLGTDERPEISYVAPDASGHYTVYWKGENLPEGATGVTVQKESSYSGEFENMAVMDLNAGSYTDLQSDAAVKSERYRLQLLFGQETGPYSEIHKGVHLSINRGMQDGQYNLIWSAYEGRRLATYRILRGSDEENLSLLASLSAGNTFYSDLNAGTGDVYYAIEYELYNETYMPLSAAKSGAKADDRYTGRSNTVGSATSRSIVMAQGMNLLSVTGRDSTTADNPNLYLYAEIFPASATYRNVTWSLAAGDEALASINQNGLLKAKVGNTGGFVTVKAVTIDGSHISATKRIYIEPYSHETTGGGDEPGDGDDDPVSVMGVSLNQSSVTLEIAQTCRLNATVAPSDATDKRVLWTSSNTGVATVDATGLVRALSAGGADIIVTTVDGGYQATCRVTVKAGDGPGGDDDPVSVTGVSLNPSAVTLEISQTRQLNATVAPADATDKTVSWRSSNTGVATVTATGLVRAVAAGKADITVTTTDGGYQATCKVTVKGDTTATEEEKLTGVNAYPNPSSGLFNVETPCPVQATVFTEHGRLLGAYAWPAAGRYTVDLRYQPSGIYLLRLSTPQAERTIKIVVE